MTEPVYPFGPSGEGGRDDAVYSSPANLQGSQARGMVSTEKYHSKEHCSSGAAATTASYYC
eukprot:4856-Heterococcus_DN1.PRE.1